MRLPGSNGQVLLAIFDISVVRVDYQQEGLASVSRLCWRWDASWRELGG
jgi:hypothetical protein